MPPGSDAHFQMALKAKTKEEAAFILRAHADTLAKAFDFDETRALVEAKIDLGYWGAYHSNETRAAMEELFECEHPIFGRFKQNGPPDLADAFKAGMQAGEQMRKARGET